MEFKEPGKIRHETHQYGKHLSMFTSDIMTFYPQAQLGEYRVDFLLEYEQIHTKYPPQPNLPTTREEMIKQMEELVEQLNQGALPPEHYLISPPTYTRIEKKIIVECDGHDFHEKTKVQAAHDKRRDRILQSLGYKVFRFTGSEIHNNAISCALEVFDCLRHDPGYREPIEF
ncbi:MAG: DUF559 domain-containing protein [Pyrinomonadaceae bacterium]|nr:DUF559 domain-containing protein [Pyrinomonadaceae bacterium]